MGRIDDKTQIPLGLAILAIGGGAMWISSYLSTIGYTASRVDAIEAERREERKEYNEHLRVLREDIATIKGYLQRERARRGRSEN
jgi:hypothetical protein